MRFRSSGFSLNYRKERKPRSSAGNCSRCGTSVGAQYREASRAKSNPDFISKIEGSLQELEESEYWLELLGESEFVPEQKLAALKQETGELKGIFVSIVRNVKAKSQRPKR